MTALDATTVGLVPTPRRWQHQPLPTNAENLHRAGGEPSWVQPPEYPPCLRCAATMRFALQLSEPLPMGESSDELWGY